LIKTCAIFGWQLGSFGSRKIKIANKTIGETRKKMERTSKGVFFVYTILTSLP
jgi:hypothetical protein